MTIPRHDVPGTELPPGDLGRITPLTRIIWVDADRMPLGPDRHPEDVALRQDEGVTLLLVNKSLRPEARRAGVRRLKQQLRGAGTGRLTAWTVVTADGLRRFGMRYPAMRTGTVARSIVTEHGAAIALSVAAAGTLAGGAWVASRPSVPPPPAVGSPAWHRHHPVYVTLPGRPLAYLGAYEPASPAHYSGPYSMEQFAATCGRQPNLALYYSGWFERFQMRFAELAASHGAIPVVQINPEIDPGGLPISLQSIADGGYDGYLVSYADAVASYGQAVVIGFGHEMNGAWYPWGWGHQSPASFVAAWRHMVNIFRRQGADNVTWLWTANVVGPKTGPLGEYWPGGNYVTWVGVDGYYRQSDDTWSSVFAPTITQIQQLTKEPILIAETAIGPVHTEPWQLDDMYASIRQSKSYLGLVWFDKNGSKPGQLFRLEATPGHPVTAVTRQIIATFQRETASWRLQHQTRGHTEAVGATSADSGVVRHVHAHRHDIGVSTHRRAVKDEGACFSLRRGTHHQSAPRRTRRRNSAGPARPQGCSEWSRRGHGTGAARRAAP